MQKRSVIFLTALTALLVGVATALVYWPTTSCGILDWDDQFHLTDNPFLQPDSPDRFGHFWKQQHGNLCIPIAYNAWALIYQASMDDFERPRASVLHGTNIIVHAMNASLVFVLLWRMLRRLRESAASLHSEQTHKETFHALAASALGALLFAAHPLQVESVAWISEFRGLSSALFGLLAMIAYLESTRRRKKHLWIWNLAGLLCFALSLLCKPSAAAIPLMLIVIDRLILQRNWRDSALSIIPWMFLSAFSLVMMRGLQGGTDSVESTAWWVRPFIASDAIVFYLRQFFWPLELSADYSRTTSIAMASGALFWLSWLIPTTLIALLIWRRWSKALACFLLAIAALAPVLGLVPFDFQRISTVADRYMYLALLGPALGMSLLIARFPKPLTFAASVIVVGLLAMLVPNQLRTWRDNQTIWTHAREVNDRAIVARANLAAQLVEAGQYAEGEKRFQQLIELAPNRVNGYLGLADLATRSGDRSGAEHLYRKAFEVDPINTTASSRLGFVLLEQGRADEAEKMLREAIELNPQNTDAMVNLGALLLTQRRFDESIALLEEAIDQHPRHAIAWANLLRVRRATDPNHISSKIIEDVKRLTQNDPWPLRLLARECLLKQEWRDAETLARASLALFPRHAETINDLAQSLAFQNRIDESIAEFERATKMRPDLTIIRDNLEKARALKASGASVTPPAPQTQQR